MKASKYNIETNVENGMIICNTITSGILALNRTYTDAYQEFIKTGQTSINDLLEALKVGKMVVEDDYDEFEALVVQDKTMRFSTRSLGLTIAPTMACNFSCPYCYEKGRDYSTMTDKTVEEMIAFIKKNYPELKSLSVSWYGGEPLLALDKIEQITREIKKSIPLDCAYHASIVSNGYYLNRETAAFLTRNNVNSVQVTIDGSQKDHDNRRILHSGEPTFEKILRNIRDTHDLIKVTVRTNVDKTNINQALEILDWFEKYDLKNKIGFYLAPVDDINGVCNTNTCMTMGEFSKEEIAFYQSALEKGFNFIAIPRNCVGICGAVSLHSFVISPEGDLYKCWNDIGYNDRCLGNVAFPLTFNKNMTKWINYDPVDKECRECVVFPMCFGGCPSFRMLQDKKCKSIRYNAEETILLMKRAQDNEASE